MDLISTQRILFICTQNSARSQMAEAILRKKYGDHYITASAGTNPTEINPFAEKVLAEIDIDVSNHRSKHVNEFLGQDIDLVVTVCDSAKESCPFFPGAKQYEHQNFEDPSKAVGTEEEVMSTFRQVRDEISDWIDIMFGPHITPKNKNP